MFFPERLKSIKATDRVLEVGPGGNPFQRSDVLLERVFDDEEESKAQRGYTEALITEKEIVFYHGGEFPFHDNEFDYVVCSHVLEHIPPDEIEFFVSELTRVAKKGYLEFPTIYYDYLYNIPSHLTFLLYKDGCISYLGKETTYLNSFLEVQRFFYNSSFAGHKSLINSLKQYFFQGFEWDAEINLRKATQIQQVTYNEDILNSIVRIEENKPPSFINRIFNKLVCGKNKFKIWKQ